MNKHWSIIFLGFANLQKLTQQAMWVDPPRGAPRLHLARLNYFPTPSSDPPSVSLGTCFPKNPNFHHLSFHEHSHVMTYVVCYLPNLVSVLYLTTGMQLKDNLDGLLIIIKIIVC